MGLCKLKMKQSTFTLHILNEKKKQNHKKPNLLVELGIEMVFTEYL